MSEGPSPSSDDVGLFADAIVSCWIISNSRFASVFCDSSRTRSISDNWYGTSTAPESTVNTVTEKKEQLVSVSCH